MTRRHVEPARPDEPSCKFTATIGRVVDPIENATHTAGHFRCVTGDIEKVTF
jgi:hypothetical protein